MSRISEKSRWCRRSRRSWSFGMSETFRRSERSMRLGKSGLARISRKLIKSKISKYQRVNQDLLGSLNRVCLMTSKSLVFLLRKCGMYYVAPKVIIIIMTLLIGSYSICTPGHFFSLSSNLNTNVIGM